MNHKQVATEVLKAVGGKENVSSLTHCITRLRFKLKDFSIPKKEEVQKIEGVISVIEKGGQYQVVIGNQVEPVFKEVVKLIGENEEIEVSEEKVKGKLFDRFTSMISGVFTPILGPLAATGILKGLLSLLTAVHVLTADSSTYQVLYAIADTVFYFFPIFLGASAAKYFKLNQYLGMAIGGAMVYPTIVAIAGKGAAISFVGIPMNILNYTSSVFPVIVAVWLASILDRAVSKVVFQGLKFMIAPFIVLVIMVPLTFFAVGPVLTFLSNILSKVTVAAYNFNPVIGGLLLGGPWILIVMFGLHWAFIPIFINNFTANGHDSMIALLTANQFAMAGAAIAIAVKARDAKVRNLSWSSSMMCLLGISEPTIYGLLLPYKKPLIMAIIGGSIGGAVAGLFKATIYAFGGAGLLQIPSAINPKGIDTGFYGFLLSAAVGLAVGFILTLIWGYNSKMTENKEA
ncbi:PTS transporter subunit EIIC [Clostridium sp. SYSU_GA19001]|uniref:PTS transporter subunit EIIC n=1 Tax=Clostridium caldaquaticum TaxID=2940653 RepID=UPI0020770B4D|nr:PTS transporter subunit EIIC [Clostridium caldaquaticum]MCM8711543.1 PTS transporter subunit EIIC [Clostridium caldaquaticum]